MKTILSFPQKKCILLLLLALLPFVKVSAQSWQLINPLYPTKDAFVAAYNVADYGASGDSVTDVTAIFQSRLDTLRILGGGTLFVPQGKYRINGTLIIPKGVTIRGEWQKPVKGQAIKGTILMAFAGRGDESATPFITMEPSSAVMDLAIWYPEQLPANITPYPPAIVFGKPNYFGNDFCNAKNVTFVNAYSGAVFSRLNGGSCPIINGLYGTPLSRGIEIDNIADVGHIESLDFSPAYWSGSGLANAPAAGSSFEGWIYQNGTGIVMRRNDWSYTSFVNIEGYNKGFHAAPSLTSTGSIPNGHNYGMTFTNCKTGIYLEVVSSDGIMFARCSTVSCETGVAVASGTSGTAQFHTCSIGGTLNGIFVDPASTTRTMLEQCTVTKGKVDVGGGTFMASDNDFNNNQPQIMLGNNSRGIVTGNRFSKGVNIQNNSLYTSTIDHTPLTLKALPAFPDVSSETKKPGRAVLYIATKAPFNAVADGTTDNTTAIQSALNKASQDGGGIVFLPPGKYKVTGHLTVPTGVELKGSADLSSVPMGPGSIIEVYADKNNAAGTPFLKLSANSGVRGMTFDYPEQVYSNLPNVPAYPYLIQVTGSDAYIVNVGMRATYSGIDLFTYKCDNHYLDFVAGHVFKNGIRVGGNSAGGKIYNLQFNTIVYAAGSESKFGSWPNSPTGDNSGAYDYNYANLDFLTLGNCQNEVLYNNFVFGSHSGIVLKSENSSGPTGLSLGLGIDGSRNSMRFEGNGAGNIDFINSQVVGYGDTTTTYISTQPTYTGSATLFNADFWGNPGKGLIMNGGTINMQQANFHHPGQLRWGSIASGSLNVHNSAIWSVGTLLNAGAGPHLSARSSIIDSTQLVTSTAALWKNNLGNIWGVSIVGAMDRQGWTATASVNSGNAKNALDSNATTRWDTQGSQVNGQSFTVDMKTVNTFHAIVLDVTNSPDDSPAGYSAFTSNDGVNWGTAIATGVGNTGMTLISFTDKTGRYIKIVQTGAKGNYWSIHELYVFGKVDVASVSITPVSARIKVDSTLQLSAAILPVNATNKAKVWTSSNTAVATVDSTGKVKGKSTGVAVITVTTLDGNRTAISTDTIYATAFIKAPPAANAAALQLKAKPYIDRISIEWSAPVKWAWVRFEIQRSADGTRFYPVETVSANPTSAFYKVLDARQAGDDSYYRLQATNARSEVAYSNVVKVAALGTDGGLFVYPNPVTNGRVSLQFREGTSGKYQLRLLNYMNQAVYQTTVNVTDTHTPVAVQWSDKILPGYYLLEAVHTNGQRLVKAIVIQ